MRKKAYLAIALALTALGARAQTTYIPMGSDDYLFLDRLETRSGRLCDSLNLSGKMEGRRNAVQFMQKIQADAADSGHANRYSKIDLYNAKQMISENGEWTDDENGFIKSKHPLFRKIYKDQYNFGYVKTKDFMLIINPILNEVSTIDANSGKGNVSTKGLDGYHLYNSHDLEFRGWFGKKLGFYTMLTDNQESLPGYVYNLALKDSVHQAVPGADYFFTPKTRGAFFAYYNASAYVDFAAVKDVVNITFGNGRNFIGDGITSLFLSDASSNMPFLRLRARAGRLNYDALYLQLTTQYNRLAGDQVYQHKYATMHFISYNAARWLNLSYFESIVFSRGNSFELNYINPVAFSLAANNFNGSGDKSLIGWSFKAIAARKLQFYGQFMLNEFKFSELASGRKWYGNKMGFQLGGKYFNALGIRNLDLQAEVDMVRPYSYAAKDTVDNYTNFNQPLADPLGAGFIKMYGIVRYQPAKNFMITLKAMAYTKGVDTGGANMGNDVFKPYLTRQKDYGVGMVNGPKSHVTSVNLNLSYQAARNCYIDAGFILRSYDNASKVYGGYSTVGYDPAGPLNTNVVYLGVRLNSPRRDYSFF